ncbi:MAG TPA: MFS transporter [Bryobacteraceae bacterium]
MRKRYGVLFLLVLLAIITFLDRISISVAAPRIQQDLGISPARWGWILGAFVLAYGLFEIPTGALGDRSGQRGVLMRVVLWWSVFTGLTGLAQSYPVLLITRFLFGAGEAGAYPNIAGALARWFPPTERARTQGFIWSASRLGGALAPLIVVPLQGSIGWRASFGVLGAMGAVWAILWRAWFHDSPAEQPGITQQELEEIGPGTRVMGHVSIPWGLLLSKAQLWLIFAMYFLQAFGSWFYFGWFPVYLMKGSGFSEKEMGLFTALPFLMGAAGNLVGGFLSDAMVRRIGLKSGRRIMGCLGLLGEAVLLVSMTMTRDHTAVVVLSSAGFGVADLMLPTAWAVCLDIGGTRAGVVSAVMNTAGQLGGFVCSVLFGYMVEATHNYQQPVWIVSGCVLAAALLFTRIDATKKLFD